jgi:hypothetical protein
MSQSSLYRRILGPRFELLPAVLKRFHDSPHGGRARGIFTVERGRGFLRHALGWLLGFPRAGIDLAVILEISVEGDCERWRREFPDRTVISTQWEHDHLLIEQYGMNSFSSALTIQGTELVYEFRQAWLAGIPLPKWVSPRIEGVVTGVEYGWWVVVRVFAPGLGEILHYKGRVEAE